MKELTEVAAQYAAEKSNEMMINAIAKAYADGYRDGYKDRKEEIPVDLRSNETEYVDLGLPSGTLWAKDYEKENGEIVYLPYGKASLLNIPTATQWKELEESCKWEFEINNACLRKAKCIGPNGNILEFNCTGKKKIDEVCNELRVYFWIFDDEEGSEKNAIKMYHSTARYNSGGKATIINVFSGYKLPIRLVQTK